MNIRELFYASTGKLKSHILIKNANLINVYSGEINHNIDIAIYGERICYVGKDSRFTIGDETRIIDATDMFVCPGFIDAHTHIDFIVSPTQYLDEYLLRGTTSIYTEPDEFVSIFGKEGVKVFLDEVRRHHVKVYTYLPLCVPHDTDFCSAVPLSIDEIMELFNEPDIHGLGETIPWVRLLLGDDVILEKILFAKMKGKIIQGHTAGAKDWKLCALSSIGISSCHESINDRDVLERLRMGYWVMLREGSSRRDLEATLIPFLGNNSVNSDRVMFVSDSVDPEDIIQTGHIDHIIRKAISLGLNPVKAIRMATLNPAQYAGLEQDIGGIAPGRYADINILKDINNMEISKVIAKGKVVVEDGRLLRNSETYNYPNHFYKSINVKKGLLPDDFIITVPEGAKRIRVIEIINENITKEEFFELETGLKEFRPENYSDLLKIAVIDRSGRDGFTIGLLKGFGARVDAFSSTLNFDDNNLILIGKNDEKMAALCKILVETGGGMGIIDGDKKLILPMEVGGVFTTKNIYDVSMELNHLNSYIVSRGFPFKKPINVLFFLSFVGLPAVRITTKGIVDVKRRRFVSLFE
ncbi:MAG: adenine deaminase C-terminal domain-containing protein [Candidatus Aenigmatarchaeota archaeon]